MGQAQSESASASESDAAVSSSMDSLIAEAAAYGKEKEQEALECPCIAHLRNGTCGDHFSTAFLCFLKSTSLEKGSDCVQPFVALQKCIKANPEAFSKDILDQKQEEEEEQDYKIYPPKWSKQPQSPKPKL